MGEVNSSKYGEIFFLQSHLEGVISLVFYTEKLQVDIGSIIVLVRQESETVKHASFSFFYCMPSIRHTRILGMLLLLSLSTHSHQYLCENLYSRNWSNVRFGPRLKRGGSGCCFRKAENYWHKNERRMSFPRSPRWCCYNVLVGDQGIVSPHKAGGNMSEKQGELKFDLFQYCLSRHCLTDLFSGFRNETHRACF